MDIHWSSWGGAVARGKGKVYSSKPTGGYGKRVTIKLKATKLRPCPGSTNVGYSLLIAREPNKAGGPDSGPCVWNGNKNLCEKHAY
jgi:hypothetical protein